MPWIPRCAVRAGSTARSPSHCPTGPNGPPSWPPTPAARTSARTPTWTRSPPPPPDSPARTWPTWSTRPPSPPYGPAAPPWSPPTSTAPAIACCSAPGTPARWPPASSPPSPSTRPATPWSPRCPRPPALRPGRPPALPEPPPADDRRLYGERYLADTLAVRLGGRAAERLIRGEASTGAADDLASATALATQMVREYGLSEAIGPVSYSGPPAGHPALTGQRGYSEHTQWL